MYLVYGSTEYNKEIHAVIGTNVLSGSTEYNKEIHAVIGTNECMGLQNITRRYML